MRIQVDNFLDRAWILQLCNILLLHAQHHHVLTTNTNLQNGLDVIVSQIYSASSFPHSLLSILYLKQVTIGREDGERAVVAHFLSARVEVVVG